MCFSSSKTQDTSQVSQNYIDPALNTASQNNYNQAAGYTAAHPYSGYSGPTQAAFGSTFGTAENAATNQLTQGNGAFTQGQQALGTGLGLAATTASTPISALMSQYTGAALDPTLQAIQRQAATANTGLAQGATMAGAFGDTGYGAQKALQTYNTTQQVGDATASAYDKAYQSALGTQQTALGQLMSGVNSASSLGSSSSGAQTNLEALLGSLGQQQQSAGQTGINTAINVNNSNQMGQLQQNSLLASILGSSPHNTMSIGNSNTVSTQPDNTGLGLLGTLIGGL